MALAIATNNAALNAAASASSVNRDMETSMARLSTGKRINSASDDAAGVAISSRLSAEIRGTDQAIRNSLDGQALIDTAEGAHKEVENILQRMREVAVQAANDTNNEQDRANLQAEMNAMSAEIDRIAGTTTWAGANLMEDSVSSFSFQVGTATGAKNQITVNIDSMNTAGLSLATAASSSFTITGTVAGDINAISETSDTDDWSLTGTALTMVTDGSISITHPTTGVVTTAQLDASDSTLSAQNIRAAFGHMGVGAEVNEATSVTLSFIKVEAVSANSSNLSVQETSVGAGDADVEARKGIVLIDSAIKTVNIQRSELGAISNRLNHTVNNLTNISSNLSAAKGGIEDADFALETTNLAKNQILQQASTAMLAQANASKQNVLSLLQG
jgi:flagellin